MKIFLKDQTSCLSQHLEYFKSIPVMPYQLPQLKERISSIALSKKRDRLNLSILFDYKIFPANIMTSLTQWDAENRSIQVGDTIVQQVYFPPHPLLSQKIILAVRVNQLIDQPGRKGFAYETLSGHAERGISTFTIEETENKLLFKIHIFSTPGHWLTQFTDTIFTSPYQSYCTYKALRNVKKQWEK
ncbi:DUF1990 family protein [Rapidithrix thailandica]|uniref:DUF1990 family protein n=1 Tax=Rapidithrix thailandica TaxID=413964 RepID=A0AAW9S9V9_9BACT